MSEKELSKELQISSSKLDKMTAKQLELFAEEKSKLILEKIELSTQGISKAKEEAKKASKMKSGWFGKTTKKTDATANAVIATNEAMAEMNELLQESIRFTCLSLSFAQAMSKHISALMVNGFKNRDGEFIKLSDDSKEQAFYIIQQAEAFAKNQLEVELKQSEQDSKIENLADKVSNNANRLDEKDKVDAAQSQRLEELEELLKNKDTVDQQQEEEISKNKEAIKVLFEYVKQKDILDKEQSEEIEKIKTFSSKKLLIASVIISSFALICGIMSIVMSIMLFK